MADPKDKWGGSELVQPAPTQPNRWAGTEEVRPGPDRGQRVLDYIEGLAAQAAQGATLGYIDEAQAGLTDMLGGRPYAQGVERNRAIDQSFEKNNPTASIAAQIGGGILAAPAMPFLGAVKGATMLGNTVRGALTGAGYGGVAGFGHGQGGLGNRLLTAGIGAGGGAILGGALPAAIAGTSAGARGINESRLGQWVGQNIMAPGKDAVADALERIAPKAVPKSLSAAGGGVPVPVDGVITNVAQALRDSAAASREKLTAAALQRYAKEFERLGIDPQTARREIERLSGGMLANTAPSGTLDSYLRIMHDLPGQAKSTIRTAVREQGEGAPGRMLAAFPDAPDLYDAQRAVAANIKAVGDTGFDIARAAGLNISDDMKRILEESPAARRAWARVISEAADKGEKLTAVDIAHRTKRFIADEGEAAFQNERISAKGSGDLADRWRKALHSANPKIQAADEASAAAMALEDNLGQGTRWMRQGTTEDAVDVSSAALRQTVPDLPPAGRATLQAGATAAARVPIGEGPAGARRLAGKLAPEGNELQARLVEIYGPERARQIIEAARNERLFMEHGQTMVGGSQSSGNLAGLFDEVASSTQPIAQAVGAPGIMARIADWGLSQINKQVQGNEGVRNAIARIGTERNPTANLQNLDVIEALMRQRLQAQLNANRAGAGVAGAGGGEIGGVFYGP